MVGCLAAVLEEFWTAVAVPGRVVSLTSTADLGTWPPPFAGRGFVGFMARRPGAERDFLLTWGFRCG